MVRKAISAILLSAALMGATACNTVRGAGEDLKSTANTVDRAT